MHTAETGVLKRLSCTDCRRRVGAGVGVAAGDRIGLGFGSGLGLRSGERVRPERRAATVTNPTSHSVRWTSPTPRVRWTSPAPNLQPQRLLDGLEEPLEEDPRVPARRHATQLAGHPPTARAAASWGTLTLQAPGPGPGRGPGAKRLAQVQGLSCGTVGALRHRGTIKKNKKIHITKNNPKA